MAPSEISRFKRIFWQAIPWICVASIFTGLVVIAYDQYTGSVFGNSAMPKRAGMMLLILCCVMLVTAWRTESRQKNDINWVIYHLNLHGAKLNELERSTEQKGNQTVDAKVPDSHWPWGAHNTHLLSCMEAAAKRFWLLYDPSDPSTAPTNNQVASWLKDEYGISNDKANAIASILRADGLPAGPRR